MNTEPICPSCRKPLPSNAPKGLCPECLIKAGFGSGVAPEPGQPSRTRASVPLAVVEVAKLFPQLEILELLGQGGMGAVYKARQPALDRLVALKILPPETGADSGFADRFTREARALARLNHPNIVGVYEFGQVSGAGAPDPQLSTLSPQPSVGLHYFVMEYVEGLNLRQLEQAGRLSAREALKIIPQICDALQFAHDEGIVHRDIKPENVMLDKKGRVKIADFGLAKILGREPETLRLTGAKDVMGTPHYMAPEQVERPQEVDHRADIYSLGVVFYEMLTGELPLGNFQAPSKKVLVDVRLDEVVLHALEKEPERRYQQASAVKSDVETIAATQFAQPREAFGKGGLAPRAQPPVSVQPRPAWQTAVLIAVVLYIVLVVGAIAMLILAVVHGGQHRPNAPAAAAVKSLELKQLKQAKRLATNEAAVSFAEAKPGEFNVTLTNGVEFAVVAIASSPRSSTVWWQPDGKLLAAPPGDEVRNLSSLCSSGTSKAEFAVLVKGAETLRAEGNAVLALDPLPQYVAAAILYTANRLRRKPVIVAGYGAAPESLTCKLGLADGPWERVATWDQAGTLLDNESGGPLDLMRSGTNDQTCLKLSHRIDANRYALRLTARLKDGAYKTAWICRVEYGSEQRARTCALIQGLQDADVVAYELYRVPLRWAHIPGIVTKPNVPPIQGNPTASGASGGTSQLDSLPDADRARAVALFNDIEDFGHEFEAAFATKSLPAAETGTRRLLNLLSNFNAVVKGTGYEFPAGIFEDIGKVQQALKEGDWDKVQQAARHNDTYAREFKRIGARMVELAREPQAGAGSGFGPVVERVIAGKGDANKRFIDLDKGRLFAAAEYFGRKAEPSPEQTQKWLKETGIDAVADTRSLYGGLVGFNLVASPVPNEEWDRMPPSRLDYYLAISAPGTPVTMSGKGGLPATYAVKTREGAQGLLQIVGISTNNPPEVRIRYKLVQQPRER